VHKPEASRQRYFHAKFTETKTNGLAPIGRRLSGAEPARKRCPAQLALRPSTWVNADLRDLLPPVSFAFRTTNGSLKFGE
jgi:hypothetical protein